MPLTHRQTLGAGDILGTGTLSPYRAVVARPGEEHVIRTELLAEPGASPAGDGQALPAGERRAIACVAHMTDLHVGDVQSPARFEFFNREFRDPRFAGLVPTQRPQEALAAHALAALVRSLNGGLAGPITGAAPELVLTGGDAIDNGQHNEVRTLLRLLDGGRVDPNSGAPEYEGVQSVDWPDDIFWVPDGRPGTSDIFVRDYGYPLLPGLLQRALLPFESPGLRLPWLGCHGNHDTLCQGVGLMTPALRNALVARRKPIALPDGFDRDQAHDTFVHRPEDFFAGPTIDVTPDAERRHCSIGEYVSAHGDGAAPRGHGFDERNLRDHTAFHVHDTAPVRFIVLDTACPGGSADLCMDETQLAWLEDRLAEVHSSYRTADGQRVQTGAGDRLVVVVSHHGSYGPMSSRPHADGTIPGAGAWLLSTLLRFDNVVLWLNGHTHIHAIHARPAPGGEGRGLWEVTTGSLVDWPCQARLVELFDAGDGVLGIASTMIDHDGPAESEHAETTLEMAALHRELAANFPMAGFGSVLEGTRLDRNAIMLRPIGFALPRAAGIA
jgi:metallophosphoesterase (TIGR03767 family)